MGWETSRWRMRGMELSGRVGWEMFQRCMALHGGWISLEHLEEPQNPY